MNNEKITFIGAGNLASSIIAGLVTQQYSAERITAIDPNLDQLNKLKHDFNMNIAIDHTQINTALTNSDCVVLAVKPQLMSDVIGQYHAKFPLTNSLFISVAAGISTHSLEKWLSPKTAIIRCMPNTPALLQKGITVLYANQHVNDTQKTFANNLLSAVGLTSWTNEEDSLHAVTATSGSGPAYFFLLMEQMQIAAEELGLDAEQARTLVSQTALGAASMAINSTSDLSTLRKNVTSKDGTTAAALDVFNKTQFNESVKLALQAAAKRSREMAILFDT